MIEPDFMRNKNGMPIIRDKEIDVIVEQILTQYKPELLTRPGVLDVDDFALYYLGLQQDFQYLSHCGIIWGMMVFNDTHKVPIYLPELKQADYTEAKEGTIIIDNTLLEDTTEYRYRSTMAHECGHWIFHKDMFSGDKLQVSLFDEPIEATIPCRSKDIESSGRRRLITPHDWIEHHAKYFSAALLMPKKAVQLVCTEIKSEMKMTRRCLSIQNAELINEVAHTFEVSHSSAQIRIQQLGLQATAAEIMSTRFFENIPSRFELIEDL